MDCRASRAGATLIRPGGAGQLRLFIAVPLPVEAASAVGRILDGVGEPGRARGIRWVQSEGLHLTLRFLGVATADAVDPIADALRVAAAGRMPFDVVLRGAGAFPSATRPRVLWLGIDDGAPELTALADALDRPLERAGWPLPTRPFRAHLTVARTDAARYDAAAAAARALIARADGDPTRFTARRVVLFRSHLGRGPARYEPLAEVPFEG
jgi:2'-5' RNA ligase